MSTDSTPKETTTQKDTSSRSATIFVDFIAIAAGVVLCLLNSRPDFLKTIIMVIGATFVLAGLINLLIMITKGKRGEGNAWSRMIGWISGIAGVLIGCALLFCPTYFTSILVYFFGGILIAAGLFQICNLAWGFTPHSFSGWLYVVPVLLIIAGVVTFSSEAVRTSDSAMVMIMGIGMILFGINSYATLISVYGKNRALKTKQQESQNLETQKEPETHEIESPEKTEALEGQENTKY